jgi:hypothetical protein
MKAALTSKPNVAPINPMANNFLNSSFSSLFKIIFLAVMSAIKILP